jgi:hypothetical protein
MIIGIFHPVVIKAEFHFGTRIWPVFLSLGILAVGLSLFLDNLLGAVVLGILGFSCLWSIRELFEQAERVERGWFPRNPRRKQ